MEYIDIFDENNNATGKIKEKADEITLSNDEDGVAVFLEKLLKKVEVK